MKIINPLNTPLPGRMPEGGESEGIICAYTLTNGYAPLSLDPFPTFDGSAQTMGYTAQAGADLYYALGTAVTGSGVIGLQLNVTGPASHTTTGVSGIAISIADHLGSVIASVGVLRTSSGTSVMYGGLEIVYTYPLDPTLSELGVYLNFTTGKIGVTIDGSDFGYQSGTPLSSITSTFTALVIGQDDQTGFDGNVISSELITSSSEIEQPLPTGAIDVCGNTITRNTVYAASFNGSSSKIIISAYALPTSYTLKASFKTTATSGLVAILGTAGNGLTVYMSATNGRLHSRLYDGSFHFADDANTTPYNDGNWHNLVITVSSGTHTVTVDGVSGTPAALGTPSNANLTRIGLSDAGSDNFDGEIKNVTLDTSHYYPVDDNSTTIEDHIGSNDGTATDLTWGLE